MTEKEFTEQVIELGRLLGWRVAHFRPARTAAGWRTPCQGDAKGWPDLVLIKGRRVIVAELKVGVRKLTAEQEEWLHACYEAGLSTYVWRPEQWATIEAVLRAEL